MLNPEAPVDTDFIPMAAPPTRRSLVRPLVLVPHRLTPAERHRRICDLAYRRAEQRGFAPGSEVEDWLLAEKQIDSALSA